jgi:DnaJ-class molecular chaperone
MFRLGRKKGQDDRVVIDLDAHVSAAPRRVVTEQEKAELDAFIDRRRAELRRREAERELNELRARHWKGERVLEEGALGIEFWEHDLADPYAVLGILPGATLEEAAAARRRIAVECHPDREATGELAEDAARRMTAANAAYERLRQALRTVQ